MAESPSQEASVTSGKRPFEEPSSPSGLTDQPDAKRPALDKVLKDGHNAATAEKPSANTADFTNGTTAGLAEKTDADGGAAAVIVKTEDPETADKQGDTVVADAPPSAGTATAAATNILEKQPQQAVLNGSPPARTASQQASTYHKQDESSWLHVRAIISSAEAATMIGKGGENVTQIRRTAGAKCTVSEFTKGAVERILTVSGLVDAVAKAFGLIIRTLNNEPLNQPSTPQSKTYPLRLLIPHILIGSIIGKGGVRIREIQDASGARLNASESCLPFSTERSLVVLGVADAVHIATYYVGSTLVEQLSERFGGPAASAYALRQGGAHGAVPGGLQVVPYVPGHVGGMMGHPDSRRTIPGAPTRTSSVGFGVPYVPPGQLAPPPPSTARYGAAPSHSGYAGAGPQQPQQYGQATAHNNLPTGSQPQMGNPSNQPVTQQIYIPNDMVGAIIGKGGAKINEIRQLSGSVIKINEPQNDSNERLVTVTGTQQCNQMALYMLYSRLGESSKNSNAIMPR